MNGTGIRRAGLAFSAAMPVSMTAESAVLCQQSTLHPGDDLGAVRWTAQELADDFGLAAPGIVDIVTWKGGDYGSDNAPHSAATTPVIEPSALGILGLARAKPARRKSRRRTAT